MFALSLRGLKRRNDTRTMLRPIAMR